MILGHAAVSYIVFTRLLRVRLNLLFIVVATYLPDFFDKTLNKMLNMPSRGYFHSFSAMLLIYTAAIAVTYAIKPLGRKYAHAGLLFYFLHIVGDLTEPGVFLWPLTGPISYIAHFNIFGIIYEFYILRLWPVLFWLDVICVAAGMLVFTINTAFPHKKILFFECSFRKR
jgi:hypothetical protein